MLEVYAASHTLWINGIVQSFAQVLDEGTRNENWTDGDRNFSVWEGKLLSVPP